MHLGTSSNVARLSGSLTEYISVTGLQWWGIYIYCNTGRLVLSTRSRNNLDYLSSKGRDIEGFEGEPNRFISVKWEDSNISKSFITIS